MYCLEGLPSNTRHDNAVQLLDWLLSHAIVRGASDIHLEPTPRMLRVRFRVNGLLHDEPIVDIAHVAALAVRIKVLFGLDVAQTRLPQDGMMQVLFTAAGGSRGIDLRVASFPTPYGEKFVIRLLDRLRVQTHLGALGFDSGVQEGILGLLGRASGFFIVSGPTGSGKTTTLYAMLSHLNNPSRNIVTMEDPIEYHLAGITQSSVQVRAGFTFAAGLRALVRADPDVIMIGEIRDVETARIALQAALTGHLVLSTLHTASALGAIPRLLDMGVEPYLVSAALSGVLAQRLLRVLCNLCSIESSNDMLRYHTLFSAAPTQVLRRATGCEACGHTGYGGRQAVGDLLCADGALHEFIRNGMPVQMSSEQSIHSATYTVLRSRAHDLLCAGITSLDEYLRFTASLL